MMKAKSFKILVIKEVCSWLPPGLDGRKVCSQEYISLITNSVCLSVRLSVTSR